MSALDGSMGFPRPASDSRWAVVHTRPRCEKKLAAFCRVHGIDCYLPLLTRWRQYGARKRASEIPLFPGYAFVFGGRKEAALVRGNDAVANLLDVHDQETLVCQLEQVSRALSLESAVELLPDFRTGMKVEIRRGPMKGVEGIVERIKNRSCIILNVDFIQQSIAVEVDADWLVPV